MLAGVKLLGRKKDKPPAEDAEGPADSDGVVKESGTTAPKGRPTPKRDVARRRGPVAPAPMTTAEARRRRKELRGPKLSRAERREDKVVPPRGMADRRERMMAGEDDYCCRVTGPVRRFARMSWIRAVSASSALHACGVGVDLHHARGSAGAAVHLAGHARAGGDHGDDGFFWAAR
jgi:hypothetical protein